MKTATILVLAAIIVLGAAYFGGVFGKPIAFLPSSESEFLNSAKTQADDYGAVNVAEFISFTHPTWGFRVNYPVGYIAGSDPEPEVSFRALANSGFSSAEVLEVRVAERGFTEKDFENTISAFAAGELVSKSSGTVDGKKAFFYEVGQKRDETGETLFVKNAVYPDCKALDGTLYTAVVTAVVPDVLSTDFALADYVLLSFKC